MIKYTHRNNIKSNNDVRFSYKRSDTYKGFWKFGSLCNICYRLFIFSNIWLFSSKCYPNVCVYWYRAVSFYRSYYYWLCSRFKEIRRFFIQRGKESGRRASILQNDRGRNKGEYQPTNPPNKTIGWEKGIIMICLFTYEFRPSLLRNSSALEKEISSFPGWYHCTDKTWLIASYEDINTVNQKLAKHLTNIDYWLVVRISPEYQGWLPKEAWDWLQNTINIMGT